MRAVMSKIYVKSWMVLDGTIDNRPVLYHTHKWSRYPLSFELEL